MLRASWLTLLSASRPTARLQNIVYIYCYEEARSFLSGEVLIYLFLFHHQVVLQATLGFTPICDLHSFARGKLRSQNVCFGFCIISRDFFTLEIGNAFFFFKNVSLFSIFSVTFRLDQLSEIPISLFFLFEVYRPTRKFFTQKETSPLPVKSCIF